MKIHELILRLKAIEVSEGADIEVFIPDDDHSHPVNAIEVYEQIEDPDDPLDERIQPGSKGVFLIWL